MSEDRRLLEAVYQAINIPYPATLGDREVYDQILGERVMHARIALEAVLTGADDPDWSAGYLLGQLAKHPPTGYRPFGEDPK
ncbi:MULTISPECIES: hypothetical protein [unclassified Streptomyces]|uniref:hypothetical protein n=1 Tax=unclassified Streptomyces TaxID=2593676 RepID=UPI00381F6108